MKVVTTAFWKGNLMTEYLLYMMTLSRGLILGVQLNEVYPWVIGPIFLASLILRVNIFFRIKYIFGTYKISDF